MTNWATEELKNLKDITNHKVIFDGFEFVWMSKPNTTWERHCVQNFKGYNKPMSWIFHHTYQWSREHKKRQGKYLANMRKSLEVDLQINQISKDTDILVKEKVNQILKLKPYMYNKEVADILGITVRTVQRCKDQYKYNRNVIPKPNRGDIENAVDTINTENK